MTATKGTGSKADSNMRETALKEWRRPYLRKLPIAATASGSQARRRREYEKNLRVAGWV